MGVRFQSREKGKKSRERNAPATAPPQTSRLPLTPPFIHSGVRTPHSVSNTRSVPAATPPPADAHAPTRSGRNGDSRRRGLTPGWDTRRRREGTMELMRRSVSSGRRSVSRARAERVCFRQVRLVREVTSATWGHTEGVMSVRTVWTVKYPIQGKAEYSCGGGRPIRRCAPIPPPQLMMRKPAK